jgi:hypothetical protein
MVKPYGRKDLIISLRKTSIKINDSLIPILFNIIKNIN